MDQQQHNAVWERRQAELWDRLFQVTQDVLVLAESMETSEIGRIIPQELVRSAMQVGRHIVRATASENETNFSSLLNEARLQAIETDYWLRLAYVVQQNESVQRDLSSIITQYSGVVDLLDKMSRHIEQHHDASSHMRGPRVSL